MIEAIELFLGTKLGRWSVIAALLAAVAFAVCWHERDVGWAERDVSAKKEMDGLQTALKGAVAQSQANAKRKEKSDAVAFAGLQDEYLKVLAVANQATNERDAAIRAGARLRIPSGCSGGADVPGSTATAPGSNGSAGAQFLGEADSAFLTGEAARADQVVRQLTLCQFTLNAERKSP